MKILSLTYNFVLAEDTSKIQMILENEDFHFLIYGNLKKLVKLKTNFAS